MGFCCFFLKDQMELIILNGEFGLVWLFGFYGISTFIGYLTPNLFL